MLKLATKSVVDQLAAIPYNWKLNTPNVPFPAAKAKPNTLFQQALVFNSQIQRQLEGEAIPSDYPQAFVQPILGKPTKLGQVWLYENAVFRVHLADWFLDDQEGGLDQNYEVFAWRDLVRANLEVFFPQYCSAMTEVNEDEDFNHGGVYHMVIDFKCAFTDLKGGILDPDQTKVIEVDPVPVQETISFGDPLPPVITLYGWKVCAIIVEVVVIPDGSTQLLDNGDVIPIQYALNMDGTLTILELISAIGIAVLTPFIIDGINIPSILYDGTTGTFDNSVGGGFSIGNNISFNASLPLNIP